MAERKNGFLFGSLRLNRHGTTRVAATARYRRLAMCNVISISLLLLMLLQLAGYFFIFAVQRYEIRDAIKRQIKAGVPTAELVLLKIPHALEAKPNAVFQRLDEHEIRYNGNMYDIVRQETHANATWYHCLSDKKETELFANLDELVKRKMNQQAERKAPLTKLLNFFSGDFFHAENKFSFVDAAEEIVASNYLFKLKTWIDPPLTPPPEA